MMIPFFRFSTAGAIAALLSTSSTVFGQAGAPTGSSTRIAYINSQKIMAEAPGRAEAEATYDKEMGSVKAQLKDMQDSLQVLMANFQKEAQNADSAKREALGKSFQEREEELSKRANDLNEKMQQRQAELARPLMEQVSKVLDDFRVKGNYAMIFDVGAPGSGVVSADKALDLTDQVLARLKELGPPKLPPATSTSAPVSGPTSKPTGVSRPRG